MWLREGRGPWRSEPVPKTHLRERLKDELAAIGDDALLITERGRAIAVTVTVDRWNALQDRLDDLQAHIG